MNTSFSLVNDEDTTKHPIKMKRFRSKISFISFLRRAMTGIQFPVGILEKTRIY